MGASPAGGATGSKTIPTRDQVAVADTWDLSSLYPSDDAWEKDLRRFEKMIPKYDAFRGHLAESPSTLAACLKHDEKVDRLA
ncbi:MAG TPA: oligoendopeptidase F, partial [Planctomycetaceae bacterium]|nr:oligoendopeptidase F [Planctomycetaceae bacterium]